MLTAQCSLGFLVTWSVVTAPEGKKAFEFARCLGSGRDSDGGLGVGIEGEEGAFLGPIIVT